MENLVELKREELIETEGGNALYFFAGLAVLAGWAHDETCGGGAGDECTWASGGSSDLSGGYAGMNFF